jgi:hypothetical protein
MVAILQMNYLPPFLDTVPVMNRSRLPEELASQRFMISTQ